MPKNTQAAAITAEIHHHFDGSFLLVTIIGGPGAGKTTLAKQLADALQTSGHQVLTVSSDDFYLTQAERATKGLKWRGLPGSVDAELCRAAIDAMVAGSASVSVPRFDMSLDERAGFDDVPGSISVCLFEGWMVEPLLTEAYGADLPCHRLSIYIDVPLDVLKAGRWLREEKIRAEHGPEAGFSEQELEAFWRESLEPGISDYVQPCKNNADLIIAKEGLADDGRVITKGTNSP